MPNHTPTDLQRRIASEFERNGWEYDLTVGFDLVSEIESRGPADPRVLAQRVPQDFLVRNNTTRDDVAEALARAIGGKSLDRPPEVATVVINDNRYSLNLGPGAEIQSSTINVGGTQINASIGAEKGDVLAAAEALITAGVRGNWNADAARNLADVIDQRNDVTVEAIRELTAEIAKREEPTEDRVRGLLADIAANAIGGALGVGLSAGLGFLL